MGEIVKALRLIVTGDSRGAVAALKNVTAASKETEAAQSGLMRGLKTGALVAAAGLAGGAMIVKKSMDDYGAYAKQIASTQRILGGTTEQVSTLISTLKLLPGNLDPSSSLALFSKNLGKAQQEGGPVADMYKKLGIALRDSAGNARPAITIFNEVRSKLSQLSDSQERNYDASVLFGRGYKELLPLLTKSDSEIAKLNKTVKDLGLVWGDKQIKTAKDLAVAQRELSAQWLGIKLAIAQGAAPALQGFMAVLRPLLVVIRALAPALKYVMGIFTAYLAVVLPIILAHKLYAAGAHALAIAKSALAVVTRLVTTATVTENLVTKEGNVLMVAAGTRTRALTVAKGALKTVSGGLGSVLGSTVGKIGLVGAATAATTVAVYEAVKAFQQWAAAAKQAEEAAAGAAGNLGKAVASGKTTDWGTSRMPGSTSAAQIAKDTIRDAYDPLTKAALRLIYHKQGIPGFAKGGSFAVTNPTQLFVAHKGEQVDVTPAGKTAGRGIQIKLDFSGAIFYGGPKGRVAEEWADALMGPLGKRLQEALGGAPA